MDKGIEDSALFPLVGWELSPDLVVRSLRSPAWKLISVRGAGALMFLGNE